MGIPSYFSYLLRQYNDIVFDIKYSHYSFNKVDRLYFDLNCAIHPCSKKIVENYDKTKKQYFEKKIIKATQDYIKKIIQLVKPTELIYLAIDGVAPRAKMEQQRSRRFKSIKEKILIKNIKKQYDPEYIESDIWDSNAITPGTKFMDTLANDLRYFIMNDKCFKNIKVILSDSNTPGEGEHKIVEYLKNNTGEYIDVIYGLDADLIMLAMCCKKNNIYLLREAIHFGKSVDVNNVDFLYLDTQKLEDYLILELRSQIKGPYENINFRHALIDDYIFLCFLIGNDFIPHCPSISIKNNGMQTLLDIYITSYNRYGLHLVDRKTLTINNKMLRNIFRELLNLEESVLRKKMKKRTHYRVNFNRCETILEKELETLNKYPLMHRELEKKINLGYDNWLSKYYKYIFHMERENYRIPCKNFMESLMWTFRYYTEGCCSWDWYYRYRHAPPFEDLCRYFEDDLKDINKLKFKKSVPYKPFRQLFTVLPVESMNLMPLEYRRLIENNDIRIIKYFPINFKVDTLFNIFFWQCLPILPQIDNGAVLKVLKKCKLTKEEKLRNKLKDPFKNF